MKRMLIGIIMLLSLSLVGCSYSVKNKEAYNEGKKYFELEDNKDLELNEQLSRTIEILSGKIKVDKFNQDDKQKQYIDYKYGILESMISRLNELKEKGIESDLLPKHEATMIELDELREKQKELYGEDYSHIIDEYSVIANEIHESYKGENIDESYIDKINEINKKYEVIENKIGEQTAEVLLESIMDDMPKTYKGTISFE